jgi:hypothetical protein
VGLGTVDSDSYRGGEGLEKWFVDLGNTWAEIRAVAEEIRVLWLGRILGVGRGGGVLVDAPNGVLIDVRDGKISSIRTYPITARRCRRRASPGRVARRCPRRAWRSRSRR